MWGGRVAKREGRRKGGLTKSVKAAGERREAHRPEGLTLTHIFQSDSSDGRCFCAAARVFFASKPVHGANYG